MSALDDLTDLLVRTPTDEVGLYHGTLTAWNPGTLANTINLGGTVDITNATVVGAVEADRYTTSIPVLVLRLRNRYYLLGRIGAVNSAYALDSDLTTHAGAADPHTGYVLESLLDAKGDLFVASAADTPARLAVGTNNHVLTADSGQATGVKWAAAQDPPRVGCRLRRVATQSITQSVATAISWDTEDQDTDGFIAVTSSTITIPTGLGGIYAITFHVVCSGITGGGGALIIDPTTSITGMPVDYMVPLDEIRDRGTIAVTIPLLAGDTFNCQAFHASAGAINFTGWMSCYRVGI